MQRGMNAAFIDADYRKEQMYKKKKEREKCKEKSCIECKFNKICEDVEENNNEENRYNNIS